MIEKIFTWEATVRDFELDTQGIVNNATYINYLEQCRNDYARSLGIDFYEYHRQGYNLVVAGINIQYKRSLTFKDIFYVTAKIIKIEDKRVHFEQNIKLIKNDKTVAQAIVTAACVDIKTGKSCMPDSLLEKLQAVCE